MGSLKKGSVVFGFIFGFLLAVVSPSLAAESLKGLPPMMTWSAYDIGSRGYVQAAAISNALTKQYGTKIRILPSGTSVGRLMPMKTGAATYGFLADEVYFAAEAIEEFLDPNWGPQDLRVMLAHPAPSAVFTTAKSGIKKMQDLRGKRVPWVVAASSLNVKLEAYLAFGGLTWKDVQVIEVPSYAASLKGVTEGKLDASGGGITAPLLYELEATPQGIYWIEMPSSDKEGWQRVQKVAPWLYPGKCDFGPGFKKGQPKEIPYYAYPQLSCYAKQDANEVYAMMKGFDATFDMYKSADPEMPEWSVLKAGKPPGGAPFHEGAIRYLKEKGIWTAEYDQWNKKFLDRMERVRQAWKKATDEAKAKGISEKDFADFWMKKRKEIPD